MMARFRVVIVRTKSGKMPDLTGWKPVPPHHFWLDIAARFADVIRERIE
jgi:hypothetical protein